MSEHGERWNQRYLEGDLPWDTGRHDFNLERVITEHGVSACRALIIGCGHGSNALWLAGQGYDVDAIDLAPKAIEQARVNAAALGAAVNFQSADILTDPLPRQGYGLIFDRGCFHSFDDPAEQQRFAQVVRNVIADDGIWLSLVGSADDVERTEGPPKRSAQQIVEIVEPLFELHLLQATHFDSNQDVPPRAWLGLYRPRPETAVASEGHGA